MALATMCIASATQAETATGTKRVWVQFKETPTSVPKLSTDPKALLDQIAALVGQAHERMNANVRGVNARLAQRKFGQARQH
ncbi:hypothetical protein AB4084_39460, partial [Lysobacter sp. 2RAB21]